MNQCTSNSWTSWMHHALVLAEQGRGWTHPNPMVGAVVLDTAGVLVGEGYHQAYGQAHAEVNALAMAGEKARGGTLVVTLAPCHHHGQTPPCTKAILMTGIQRVVYGSEDPNPVAAGGVDYLRKQGLEVISGIDQAACQDLNRAFFHRLKTGRPYVLLKMATTLDGRTACRNGQSQWITHEASRKRVHALRAESDAILSTAETLLADNARFSVRDVSVRRQAPIRVILDRTLRIPPTHPSLRVEANQGPVWVYTAASAAKQADWLAQASPETQCYRVPDTGLGLDLDAIFDHLGQAQITQVLVEAGPTLASSLLAGGWVQALLLMVGNQVLGDGPSFFQSQQPQTLQEALCLTDYQVEVVEDNLWIWARPVSKA